MHTMPRTKVAYLKVKDISPVLEPGITRRHVHVLLPKIRINIILKSGNTKLLQALDDRIALA